MQPEGFDGDRHGHETDSGALYLIRDDEGRIIGSVHISPVDEAYGSFTRAHTCPNYSYSTHPNIFWYTAYVGFKANHKVANDCNETWAELGANIKRGGCDYKRNGASVLFSGGPAWTKAATSKTDDTQYWIQVSADDSLWIFGASGTTYYYRYWEYF